MAATSAFLELIAVAKHYPAAGGDAPVPILRSVDLTVQAGESVAFLGPSGSGKTTLLNLIGTLDRPDSGRVLLEGVDLTTLDEAGVAAVRQHQLGFVFQAHHLLPHLSVLENVLVPTLAAPHDARRRAAPDRARRLLKRVGLEHRLTHRPGQLSGGERQRAAVVRALINEPRLVLADEPTGALDQASARELARLLVELNREEGVTLIVVTHALELARDLGRRLELVEGRLEERS